MVRWHAGKALAGATGGWIDLRGQPSGCGRRGTGRVRSCSEGDICRRLRDMPDHHTLNLRQRRDAGCMMFERGVSRLTLGSSGSSTPGSRCGSDRSGGGDEQYPSGSRGPGCWARTNCPPTSVAEISSPACHAPPSRARLRTHAPARRGRPGPRTPARSGIEVMMSCGVEQLKGRTWRPPKTGLESRLESKLCARGLAGEVCAGSWWR